MLYVYECPKCKIRFERRQHIKDIDTTLQRCPQCKQGVPRRVMQPVGVVFRGKGFYTTDSRA